jgi:transcriptional regulator with XRE-family HTH domain
MEFHEILKKKRKELSMTQEQVAEQIFVSQKSVSNWETQKTYPDIESLIRLARLYDLSLDHLLLEGSDIVKDMKTQEELNTMKKLSISPFITNVSLILLLISQKWWGYFSTPAVFVILICMISNFIPLFYFKNRENYLKNELEEKTLNSWVVIALLVVLVILAIGTIIFIPTFLKK